MHIAEYKRDGNVTGAKTMKTYNHIFTTVEEFDAFLTANSIDRTAEMLLRIHTSVHNAEDMQAMVDWLRERLPHTQMIGCNSSSVIYNGRRMSDVCMLSLTITEQCHMKSAQIPCFLDGVAVPGEELAKQVCEALSLDGKKGMLLAFVPQKYYQCSKFAQHISICAPGIKIAGGVASDMVVEEDGSIAQTGFTLTQDGCCSCCISVLALTETDMFCYSDYALGVEKISEEFVVTDYEENMILGVDGEPPLSWLGDMAGEAVMQENKDIFDIFPLIRSTQAHTAWPIQFVSEGHKGFVITDSLEPGERIRIGYVSPNMVVDEVNRMYRELKRRPVESLFVYSCTLRKKILQNCSSWEMTPLKNTSASGAFLGGEFFYDGKSCRFGNCTFSVTALACHEVYVNLNTQMLNNTHNLHHDNEHLVDYLSSCAMGQQGDIYTEMKSRLYADKNILLGNMTKFSYDVQVKKLNKLCLISLRNVSELIAYAGYRSYNFMFQEILLKMQDFLGTQSYWYYLSEQGEILISANDDVTSEQFEERMRQLEHHLVSAAYFRLSPVFEFCLVLNEVNLLRNAKVVQSVLRTDNKNRFMVYSKEMGMEERSVHDVQMLQIINEAIAHHRVLPFYQGIYDNAAQKITMYESLMRLTDADGKLYYPNDFFPVARKYGLYGELSRCLIDKVMQTFELREGNVTMNLAMQDILDPQMTDLIYGHMQHSSCPQKFVFEVVETEDIHDYEAIGRFADKIHSFGGKIALDDFGSGFSNLVHVIGLDLDYLKVDGAIIKKICVDDDCRSLLELVAVWCRMHHKKVIAEFVENQEIQQLLCQYNVDYSQGYFFSKPVRMFE